MDYEFDGIEIALLIIIGCTIGLFIFTSIKQSKEKVICENKKDYSISQPLKALIGKTESEIHGSMGGSYFLFMGGVSGSIDSENNYILKYAVQDDYGVQLKTEKINNDSNIRIKEVDSSEAKLTTIYYNQYLNYGNPQCQPMIKMKIFEIPKGSIKKEYNIDLTK